MSERSHSCGRRTVNFSTGSLPDISREYIRRWGAAYMYSPNSRSLMTLFHTRCAEAEAMHDNEQMFRYFGEHNVKDGQMSYF